MKCKFVLFKLQKFPQLAIVSLKLVVSRETVNDNKFNSSYSSLMTRSLKASKNKIKKAKSHFCFSFRIIGFCHFTVFKLLCSFLFQCFFSLFSPLCSSHRHQQEQAAKQTQQCHQPVCGSKALPTALEHRISVADDNGGDDNNVYELASGESDDETIELWSHELPVWIKGEQRWISGVTDQTTCLDLIEALLIDEGVIKTANDSNNNNGTNLYPTKVNDYVIAERWRRVEQILDPRTKILKIWTAWGAEQSEVTS